MSLGFAIAIYFVVWWITLFAVLPFGVRTLGEEGDASVRGAPDSAPARLSIATIVFRNTVVATLVFGVIYYVMEHSGWSIMSIPLP